MLRSESVFGKMANVLVLNAGSGSQKVALYSIDPGAKCPSDPVWQAAINSTTPGQPEDKFIAQIRSTRADGHLPVPRDWSLQKKIQTLVRASWEGQFAVLEGSQQIDLAGHRVVHGGLEFSRAALVTPDVEATIERLGELAPFTIRLISKYPGLSPDFWRQDPAIRGLRYGLPPNAAGSSRHLRRTV